VKAQVARAIVRVDAMTRRERVMIFVCLLAVLGAITYLFFVLPLLNVQKQRAAQIDQSSAEMDMLRDRAQVGMLEARRSHATQLDADIARVQGEIDALERELAGISPGTTGDAAGMPAILRRVLVRTDKVALVRVSFAPPEAGAAPPPGVAGTSGSGLDITLAGRYLDLMDYLATLEAALPQARWGSLRLTSETVPAQVTVRILMPQGRP
jgi:MSHA biogenesis protein MshJ